MKAILITCYTRMCVCYGAVMHSFIDPISKTYRVYSNVEESLRSGEFTERAVAVRTSWLLEQALERLHRVVEASEEGIPSSLVKMALQNVRDIYSNIYRAREGTANNIKKALVDNGREHISKLRTVLLYLALARSKSLPNEGPAGASVTEISAASYNAASALSILQSNLGLPDEASVNTRDRLCVLLDSLSGTIELIPGRALLRSVRGSTGFISPSEVRNALLLAVEEAHALVYTTHDSADKDARGCVQGALELVLYSIKRVICGIRGKNISSRASWSCALASQMMYTIQEVFDGYVSNTHTRDSDVSDKEFLSNNVIRAFTSARHLLASCVSVPPEERPSSSEYVIRCSGMLREVYSHLGTCESIDLANPHGANNILPALNKAREALDEVDPSDLPSHRDAETYSRIREAIMQASRRCIMQQCSEPDLLDSALGAGWDALSIEGLGAGCWRFS
ncbi:hypothetical protein APHNYW_0855 [Anaplasma phagocytophilum str. ApNYW]|nr:hypothetical protein APHNYW_0855 [Anaplasma phagocytophilum str. ApNYW]